MRHKALSVCAITIAVFLGLWLSLRVAQPPAVVSAQSSSSPSGLEQDHSYSRLASLASMVAGALAFAVIPGRGKRSLLISAASDRSHNSALRAPRRDHRMRRNLVVGSTDRNPRSSRTPQHYPQSPVCEERMRVSRRTAMIVQGQVAD